MIGRSALGNLSFRMMALPAFLWCPTDIPHRGSASVRGRRGGRHIMPGPGTAPACLSLKSAQIDCLAPATPRHHRGPRPGLGPRKASAVRRGQFSSFLALISSVARYRCNRVFRTYAVAASFCLAMRKSVPSIHIRCSTTPIRRASATVARFLPRRLATFSAHVRSQLGRPRCSMTVAAW